MRQRHMILMVSCCRICSSTGASSDHSDDVGSMQSGTRGLVWVVKSDTYSPDDNLWIVDGGCSNLTQLDNVTFTLGEHRFLLRPDQYVLQVQLPRPVLLHRPSSHTVERLWVARHAGLRPCSLPCQTPLAVLGLGPMTCGPSQ